LDNPTFTESETCDQATLDKAASYRLVLERHGRGLTALAYAVCQDGRRAGDIVTQAFARAWPRWSVGAVDDLFVEVRRSVILLALEPPGRSRFRLRADDAVRGPSWAATGLVGETPELVRDMLALPDDLRTVVALRYVAGMQDGQIGALLGMPQEELSARLAQASRALDVADDEELGSQLRKAMSLLPLEAPSNVQVSSLVGRRRRAHAVVAALVLTIVALAVILPITLTGSSSRGTDVVLPSSRGSTSHPRHGAGGPSGSTGSPSGAPTTTIGASSASGEVAVATHTLASASTPPVVPECSISVTSTAGGNFTPLFCTNNGVNVLAWQAYEKWQPLVMTLGPGPSPGQLELAMCSDVASRGLSANQEVNVEQLASRYYGWSSPPTFREESCHPRS
jgi:RNA polymerase sigma-70 factor, ECF subfamily